jgi:hypothetical protein
MRKTAFAAATGLAAIVLLGAGCAEVADTPDVQFQTKAAETAPAEVVKTPEAPTDLVLTAENIGNRSVKFTWTAPAGLTDANRFILVEGIEENPVHDGKHNWYRQYYANRAVVWGNQSSGRHHYRICLTENSDENTCVRYSNDVEVEVK